MTYTTQSVDLLVDGQPQPIRAERGASILGPRNIPLETENPDLLASPYTDAGTIPNLKFSFAASRNRLGTGGWAREITVRELPVATTLAGVNMRLKPGGMREMHWHKEAEWAFMLAGRARITAIDPQGRNFIDDVGVGDLWNFPAGIPHSIQGLQEGCEFLLVFDNGNFSENETFLLSDWFAHTPRSVLAKNFGVPESSFDNMPKDVEHERWVFDGKVPGQYYINGRGRMTVFASGGKARTFDYQAGDVGYVPFAMGHYVENCGDEPLRFLEMFRSAYFADMSANQWMALTPPELVQAHLNLDARAMAALRKDKPIIVK
jgi:oxalate decarboxylase/phosphoglucose isomerase-like protein (cupin superfamily)